MKVIACYSNKGGVGKTATSVNFAYAMANAGHRTLLCDLDPQGASSFYFRIKPSKKLTDTAFFDDEKKLTKSIRGSDFPYLDLLPANMTFRDFDIFLDRMKNPRSKLKKALKSVNNDYDYVVLDCPPNISLLSENVFKYADKILVPVIPTTLSERTLEQLYSFFGEHSFNTRKIQPFFSMVQRAKNLHVETIQRLSKKHKRFLITQVPFSADIEKMGIHRAPVATFARGRPASKAYQNLFNELSVKL